MKLAYFRSLYREIEPSLLPFRLIIIYISLNFQCISTLHENASTS